MIALVGIASERYLGAPEIVDRSRTWPTSVLMVGLVFLLALTPRLLARDVFITSDEDQWMSRSGGFAYALTTGELRRTYQNGHPGVTTMWLGVLGMGQAEAYRFADRVHGQRFVAVVPGFWESLAQARVAVALVTALGTAVFAALVARIWGIGPGGLAGALVALDPWSVGLQQLLHTDGLLAGFMVIAALAGLVFWWARGGWGFIALAGVAAGLALLSKTPALFLLPFGVALALIAWRAGRCDPTRAIGGLAVYLAIAAATFVALWPALWLAPIEMLGRMFEFLRETGGQPDEVGSFFFGQALADPGPLYYPVALAIRLSPAILLGLLGLVLAWRRVPQCGAFALVALFIGGFGLMMTLGPKKFDRYLLPIEPTLALVAALGLWFGVRQLLIRRGSSSLAAGVVVVALSLGLQAWALMSVYPYYLAYYNPLLGGGAAAERVVMVGNGEGLDQAAAWLNAQPEAGQLWVASHSFDILQGMYVGSGEPLRERAPSQADYVVLYGRRIQMRRWGQSLEIYLAAREPVHVVRINGIEMVRIYRGPHAEATGRA